MIAKEKLLGFAGLALERAAAWAQRASAWLQDAAEAARQAQGEQSERGRQEPDGQEVNVQGVGAQPATAQSQRAPSTTVPYSIHDAIKPVAATPVEASPVGVVASGQSKAPDAKHKAKKLGKRELAEMAVKSFYENGGAVRSEALPKMTALSHGEARRIMTRETGAKVERAFAEGRWVSATDASMNMDAKKAAIAWAIFNPAGELVASGAERMRDDSLFSTGDAEAAAAMRACAELDRLGAPSALCITDSASSIQGFTGIGVNGPSWKQAWDQVAQGRYELSWAPREALGPANDAARAAMEMEPEKMLDRLWSTWVSDIKAEGLAGVGGPRSDEICGIDALGETSRKKLAAALKRGSALAVMDTAFSEDGMEVGIGAALFSMRNGKAELLEHVTQKARLGEPFSHDQAAKAAKSFVEGRFAERAVESFVALACWPGVQDNGEQAQAGAAIIPGARAGMFGLAHSMAHGMVAAGERDVLARERSMRTKRWRMAAVALTGKRMTIYEIDDATAVEANIKKQETARAEEISHQKAPASSAINSGAAQSRVYGGININQVVKALSSGEWMTVATGLKSPDGRLGAAYAIFDEAGACREQGTACVGQEGERGKIEKNFEGFVEAAAHRMRELHSGGGVVLGRIIEAGDFRPHSAERARSVANGAAATSVERVASTIATLRQLGADALHVANAKAGHGEHEESWRQEDWAGMLTGVNEWQSLKGLSRAAKERLKSLELERSEAMANAIVAPQAEKVIERGVAGDSLQKAAPVKADAGAIAQHKPAGVAGVASKAAAKLADGKQQAVAAEHKNLSEASLAEALASGKWFAASDWAFVDGGKRIGFFGVIFGEQGKALSTVGKILSAPLDAKGRAFNATAGRLQAQKMVETLTQALPKGGLLLRSSHAGDDGLLEARDFTQGRGAQTMDAAAAALSRMLAEEARNVAESSQVVALQKITEGQWRGWATRAKMAATRDCAQESGDLDAPGINMEALAARRESRGEILQSTPVGSPAP